MTDDDYTEQLECALRTILRGFHERVFVRSIRGDSQSDWAIRLAPFIGALSQAQEMLGGDQCVGEDCPIHGWQLGDASYVKVRDTPKRSTEPDELD